MIDDEARTTSRSENREGLAPLMICIYIIPLSRKVARFIRGLKEKLLAYERAKGSSRIRCVELISCLFTILFFPPLKAACRGR